MQGNWPFFMRRLKISMQKKKKDAAIGRLLCLCEVRMDVNCPSCNATGIYKGHAEGRGIGVVCLTCDGKGYIQKEVLGDYKFYIGRKKRKDVDAVFLSKGRKLCWGPYGESVTYREFLAGKMPTEE